MRAFFLDSILRHGEKTALICGSTEMSFAQLDVDAKAIADEIPSRSLLFCVCSNTIASVAGYVGFLQKRIVPVMLSKSIDMDLFRELIACYQPGYIWCPEGFWTGDTIFEYDGYLLLSTGREAPEMHASLALLLTTSGSTGSPKFVRQSYRNIEANTSAIVDYLNIETGDRAITTLPMSYTYGLSIIQSHLMAGAAVILTERTFFEREFWEVLEEREATTFGAVPYGCRMLDRLRFLQMDLPALRYITQAGGRLGEELHFKFAEGLREKKKAFIVMYGATEATARMSYVPADRSVEKAGSIGIPIPGGRFELIDPENGMIDEADRAGELIYYGENVTLGYAQGREDLALGDERQGRLETGDIAKRDPDGFYYIVGRKKRFLKIFGNRVNLVEVEELLSEKGYETACVGEDDHMRIYTTSNELDGIERYISEKTGLHISAFQAIHIDTIPHNDSGKVLYSELK